MLPTVQPGRRITLADLFSGFPRKKTKDSIAMITKTATKTTEFFTDFLLSIILKTNKQIRPKVRDAPDEILDPINPKSIVAIRIKFCNEF